METADLFAPPRPAPPLPTGEQESMVLARLRRGPLTPLQALKELGVMRLAAVVYRLKALGWDIHTEDMTAECRGGRSARVARYHLTNDA